MPHVVDGDLLGLVIHGTVIMDETLVVIVTQIQPSWSFAQDGQEWRKDISMNE